MSRTRHIELREPYEDPPEVEEITRSEIRLMGRALRNGWIADPDRRAELIEQLYKLALDPETQPRSRIGATKAIMAAERVEQGWRDLELKQEALAAGQDQNQTNILVEASELALSDDDDRGREDDRRIPPPVAD